MRLLLLATLVLSTNLHANILTVPADRTVRIMGEVNGSILPAISKLETLSRSSSDPIFILINSPGGSILAGNLFINAMHVAQNRGVKLHCASTMFAASMAFQFLVECDYRYAFKHTKLLFHPPRIMYMGVLLETQMRQWIEELEQIESKMIPVMQEAMGLSDEVFNHHYHAETFWDAEDLQAYTKRGFITIIDDIVGITNIFQINPLRSDYQNGALIWIAPWDIK